MLTHTDIILLRTLMLAAFVLMLLLGAALPSPLRRLRAPPPASSPSPDSFADDGTTFHAS